MKGCKTCGSTTRKLPHPGPRCGECHRAVVKERKAKAHGSRIEKTYGITAEEYQRIYEYQDGRCAICRRATGATRRLSVDHRHDTGLVSGLCCRPCNDTLGLARDDVMFFVRAIQYLTDPPAVHALGGPRYAPM